jgi:hypothetical protein
MMSGDVAFRHELKHDRDIAEGEIQIDEAHPACATSREGNRDVRGERRLATAALGREDRDDPGVEFGPAGHR